MDATAPPAVGRLDDFMWANKMRRRHLADKLGVSPSTVTDLLKGRRIPSLELAVRIERLTGVQAAEWLPPEE